jgi:hypothetical protein
MSPLLSAAALFAERIKVNAITSEVRDGRRFWLKRRRRTAPLILAGANQFFQLAGNPVQALIDLPAWQRWELESFQRLHGDNFRAFAVDARTVAVEEVPGISLSRMLEDGTLTPAITTAAGRELRRSHEMECATMPSGWSHGDPHAGNFIYEAGQDRARLIDFEVTHVPGLPVAERHADDLLVFLQDVMGRVSAEAWLPLALGFLEGYGRPEIIAQLLPRLQLPGGIPRLWWAVRTTYMSGPELTRRLEELRLALTERGGGWP